jgi:hypothetical protein
MFLSCQSSHKKATPGVASQLMALPPLKMFGSEAFESFLTPMFLPCTINRLSAIPVEFWSLTVFFHFCLPLSLLVHAGREFMLVYDPQCHMGTLCVSWEYSCDRMLAHRSFLIIPSLPGFCWNGWGNPGVTFVIASGQMSNPIVWLNNLNFYFWGVWTQGLHLELLHQHFFMMGFLR